ncbi:hypothetical protein Memar_1393 [Methanoculleus marisnigri JR1]|uniref:Uncharacterized protein n=2 Tax=Methanoculleus TaxID=45989 RepID=A3CVC2_METMJ|nr:hypothetical protein Memar_1393 [Methanoculleus marisnigri JR1]
MPRNESVPVWPLQHERQPGIVKSSAAAVLSEDKCQPFCRPLFHIQLITMHNGVIHKTIPSRRHGPAGMFDATGRQIDLRVCESQRLAEDGVAKE